MSEALDSNQIAVSIGFHGKSTPDPWDEKNVHSPKFHDAVDNYGY